MAEPFNRKFTISFPEDLAKKVDLLAEMESRNTSDLFREAFRVYFAPHLRARTAESRELAAEFNPKGFTREDTQRLMDEARAEMKLKGK